MEDVGSDSTTLIADKLRERKAGGIFFTSSTLADFLCAGAVQATLDETAPLGGETDKQLMAALQNRVEHLLKLRAVDLACGSGAFRTAWYREFLQEFRRLQSAIASLSSNVQKLLSGTGKLGDEEDREIEQLLAICGDSAAKTGPTSTASSSTCRTVRCSAICFRAARPGRVTVQVLA